MNRLNRPLRAWHAIVLVIVALALGACATAIATGTGSGGGAASVSKVVISKSHGYSYVRKTFTNHANSVDQGIASCSRHQVPVGGGGLSGANNTSGAQALNSSYPHDDGDRGNAPDGWAIFIDNTTAQNQEAQVFAICKRVR